MNSIMLDVAIGLVFIFLLYSLLASTINEFIAMIFAYRHRMLEKAIEQMLDGENYSYYWWDKLMNILRWAFESEKANRYGKNFAQENSLLSKEFKRKQYFSTRQVNNISAHENKSKTEEEKPEKRHYIKRNKLNKKAHLFAAKIINHPQYRRKSEQSFLFKKPAYLTASSFSDILLDVLGNRRSCNSSAPLLMNDVKSFVSRIENNDDLKSILNFYIEQANGDIQKFKLLLEDWYDDTMERVSGWYKRQATKVLFVIGLVLAITFNVSTIEIVHKLSINKDLREAMAQSASAYVKQNPPPPGKTSTVADQGLKDEYNKIKKFYDDSIASMNMMMGLGWGDFGNKDRIVPIEAKKNKETTLLLNSIIRDSELIVKTKNPTLRLILFEKGEKIGSIFLPSNIKEARQKVLAYLDNKYKDSLEPSIAEKIEYVFTSITIIDILGFLITALAITLGAPFWFDLLNKFVNVRAGGNKPAEDNNTQTTASKTVVLNQKPTINSFG